jgi:hypothetical protein
VVGVAGADRRLELAVVDDLRLLQRPRGLGVAAAVVEREVRCAGQRGSRVCLLPRLGFGRIAASEIEVPNMLANMV